MMHTVETLCTGWSIAFQQQQFYVLPLLSPIPELQICTAQQKKKRKIVMEGSKKILQSAHTTGPPYSLFQSHFIRLKEYGGVMMLKRK